MKNNNPKFIDDMENDIKPKKFIDKDDMDNAITEDDILPSEPLLSEDEILDEIGIDLQDLDDDFDFGD